MIVLFFIYLFQNAIETFEKLSLDSTNEIDTNT